MNQKLSHFLMPLTAKTGEFPIKHLGIPLHYEKLRRADIQPLVDMILNSLPAGEGGNSTMEVG
jgi:hypothetical protein